MPDYLRLAENEEPKGAVAVAATAADVENGGHPAQGASSSNAISKSLLGGLLRRLLQMLHRLASLAILYVNVVSDVYVSYILILSGDTSSWGYLTAALIAVAYAMSYLCVLLWIHSMLGWRSIAFTSYLFIGLPIGISLLDLALILEALTALELLPSPNPHACCNVGMLRLLLPSYRAARELVVALCTNVPQIALQSYILLVVLKFGTGSGDRVDASNDDPIDLINAATLSHRAVLASLAASSAHFILVVMGLLASSAGSGVSVRAVLQTMLALGGQLPLEPLHRQAIVEWRAPDGSLESAGAERLLLWALEANTSLHMLVLYGARLSAAGMRRLVANLGRHRAIRKLDVGANGLSEETAIELIELAAALDQYTSLGLGRCAIGLKGATSLATYLRRTRTLRVLCLNANPLGNEGARALGDGLCANTTLEELTAIGCKLQAEGGRALSEGLARHPALTTLDLRDNAIGEAGAAALANALAGNSTLTALSLARNRLEKAGTTAIIQALDGHTSCRRIDMQFNWVDPDTKDEIRRSIQPSVELKL